MVKSSRAVRRSHINQLEALIQNTTKEIMNAKSQEFGRWEHWSEIAKNRIHMEETLVRAKATLARLQLEELET